jgi:hypothetical protein
MNDKKNNSIENVKNSEKFPLFVVVDGPTPSPHNLLPRLLLLLYAALLLLLLLPLFGIFV